MEVPCQRAPDHPKEAALYFIIILHAKSIDNLSNHGELLHLNFPEMILTIIPFWINGINADTER